MWAAVDEGGGGATLSLCDIRSFPFPSAGGLCGIHTTTVLTDCFRHTLRRFRVPLLNRVHRHNVIK